MNYISVCILISALFSTNFSSANESVKESFKDYLYINTEQSYYKFHPKRNWNDAKKICESEGSIFWHPKNRSEAESVVSLFRNTKTFSELYVGLSDIAVEGSFKTIDGLPIKQVYNDWSPTQPDNANNEDCGHMLVNYKLNDISCSFSYPFICKKTKISVQEMKKQQCGNLYTPGYKIGSVKDYEYIKATQSFYKFHSLHETWSDALRICESEGARLFYPETENEMREVLSFCKQKGPFTYMFIGISDLMVKKIFETIDGKLLKEVYNKWMPDEPNYLNCTEDCIAVDDKGLFNDISCSTKYPFVCKKLVRERNNKCNMDYTFNEEEGKCYKLYKTEMSWIDAFQVCREEKSYLAVINSKRERDHLLSLRLMSPDQVTEVLPNKTIHLGFHNRFGGGWFTVRGETLEESGYAFWDKRQSKTSEDVQEKCGSMSYAGTLRAVACDTKSFFICEHDLHGQSS